MTKMMEKLIKIALFTPNGSNWGLPLLFWGAPGASKSAKIEQAAEKWGLPCEVLCPGERGEGAFGVVPVPIEKSDVTRLSYPLPEWLDLFEDTDGRGVVFGDELNTADPRIQAALLGMMHARRIGGGKLPQRCRVLAAANPVTSSAGGHVLGNALANRLGHIDYEMPSVEDWSTWLLSDDGTKEDVGERHSASAEEDRVMKLWAESYAIAKGAVTGFLSVRQELIHKEPKKGDPSASRAWPSHRSWLQATRAIAGAYVHREKDDKGVLADNEDVKILLCSAFIGLGPTEEFMVWRSANDLPNPVEILEGKHPWQHNPRRLDLSMAVVNSCVALVCNDGCTNREARTEKLWEILTHTEATAADIVATTIKPLATKRLTTGKTAIKLLAKMRPTLAAAGLVA